MRGFLKRAFSTFFICKDIKERPILWALFDVLFVLLYVYETQHRTAILFISILFFLFYLIQSLCILKYHFKKQRQYILLQLFKKSSFFIILGLFTFFLAKKDLSYRLENATLKAAEMMKLASKDSSYNFLAEVQHIRLSNQGRLRLEMHIYNEFGKSYGTWVYYPSYPNKINFTKIQRGDTYLFHLEQVFPLSKASSLLKWLLSANLEGYIKGCFLQKRLNHNSSLSNSIGRYIHHQLNQSKLSENEKIIIELSLLGKTALWKKEKEIRKEFHSLGVAHLLCVSGFHLGVILLFFSFLCPYFLFPRKQYWLKILLSIFIVIFLILCIGATASLLRASSFAVLFLLSRIFFRQSEAIHILCLIAILQLLISPLQLYAPSFILSYIAVASILLFYKKIAHLLPSSQSHLINYLWELFAIGLSAQILLWPLLIYYFSSFSLLFLWTSIPLVVLSSGLIFLVLIYLLFSFLLPINYMLILNNLLEIYIALMQKCLHFFQHFPSLEIKAEFDLIETLIAVLISYIFFCYLLSFSPNKK